MLEIAGYGQAWIRTMPWDWVDAKTLLLHWTLVVNLDVGWES